MNPKNRQLLFVVVWSLLALLNLYRLFSGDFEQDSFRRLLGIVATVSFAVLAVSSFRMYRKL
jgi:hypothetical protein